MSGFTEEARIKMIVDGTQANATFKEMKQEATNARKAIEGMAANDPNREKLIKDYQKLTSEMAEQKTQIQGTAQQATALGRSMGGATGQVFGLFDTMKSGVSTGVKMFTTLKGAIAATGIGLLVIAVAALFDWFKKTDEGAMILDGIMRALGATMNVLFDRIMNIGDTLTQLFTNPIKFFKDLGNDIKDAAKEGYELAVLFDELDDKRRAMELSASENQKQVAIYLKKSQDIAKSLTERLDILEKADKLETQNMQTKLAYQDQLIAAIKRENAESEKSGHLTDEQKDKLNQAMIERNSMEQESMELGEKINNRRSKLIEAQQAEEKKVSEDRQKAFEKEMSNLQKLNDAKNVIDKIRNDALKAELAIVDASGVEALNAAKKRYYEEGKTAEWLAQEQKRITLGTAQWKLQTVKKFGEDELAYEVAVLEAKDNLSPGEKTKLTNKLKSELDSWTDYYDQQLTFAAKNADTESARLAAEIEQIELHAAQERNIVGNNKLELQRIEDETNQKIEEATLASQERKLQMIQNGGNKAIAFAGQLNNLVNIQESNELNKEKARYKEKTDLLKKQLDDKTITQAEYDTKKQALDQNMDRANASNERSAALRSKMLSAAQIGFDTATGIMKAVAASPLTLGMPWSAIIGGMGALQLTAVLSKDLPQAFDGGFTTRSSSDRTPFPMMGHANEYMISANPLRDPFVMNTVNLIESAKRQNTTPSEIIRDNIGGVQPDNQVISMMFESIGTLNQILASGIGIKFDDETAFKLNKEMKRYQERDKLISK